MPSILNLGRLPQAPLKSPSRALFASLSRTRLTFGLSALLTGASLVVASIFGFSSSKTGEALVSETAPAIAIGVETTGEALPPAAPAPERLATDLPVEQWYGARIYLVEPASWTDRSRAAIDEALGLLPASVRGQLGNPDLGPMYISVNREGRTLSGAQPYQRAANFYSTNESRNEVVLYTDQSARTVLHELGHSYNLRQVEAGSYAQVFLQEEMQSFLKAAGWRILTSPSEMRHLRDHADVRLAYDSPPVWSRLSRDDPLEDFANSFAAYFAAPQELRQLSPSRYNWFQARFGAAD